MESSEKKNLYEWLMKRAYDDNHGITMRIQDYEREISRIKNKKKPTKSDLLHLSLTQRDRKEFIPQWIHVDDLKKACFTDEINKIEESKK